MGLPQISGLVGGVLAILAGIIIIIKPQIIAWILGIYLIIFGAFAVLAAVAGFYLSLT
ncbi:MAG: hypothetical protein PHR43_07015 [Dehalococcoidales bacterium]|nr:hypothetical protein [Dehalococcoidales bacterium]